MFETNEEQEMLYTLSVNLNYFANEMKRGKEFYKSEYNGKKRSENYSNIAKLLEMTCSLVKENLNLIKKE